MKNLYRFILPATLFASVFFAAPAYAITCPSGCSPGTLNPNSCVDAGGEVCSTGAAAPSGGGGGAVSNQYLQFYKDFVVGTVNNILVPILIALAFIIFLWGVYKYYIYHADNEAERKKGHQLMLWGIIGFVVILSVWGIVNIVKNIIIPGTASSTHPTYPTI